MKKTIRIPAKINLYLDVTDKMPSGYHELETVMQSIDIFDIVTLRAVKGSGRISVFAKEGKQRADFALPQPRNTAYRAAELFAAAYPDALSKDGVRMADCDFEMELIKNIPSEAGLGGASADAAAVLTILSDMFDAGTDENELIALGAKIGADVPFCIRRGTVLARGIGEKMTDTLQNPTLHLLIAKPYGENISTPLAFAEIDARGLCKKSGDINAFVSSMERGDFKAAAKLSLNKFESTLPAASKVFAIKEAMLSCGAHMAQMSGSGSAVFGIFADTASFRRAEEAVKKMAQVYPCHTLARDASLDYEEICL
ncbi:MAG: 4-(cytidine 5'-diphospho)-2-C-methyl-D-erythritol kinase [Ruminococcus sp.]|nr:4-(cytidine 5'-diphospho)-2-C-methyl-D-erythritol kinase [Candidatus Apopatosoma intestinale]